jgi:5'-phosphate synthase pdxT subunit
MTFIRAPYVESADSDDVEILATVDDRIVGVQYRNQLALAFHPELDEDRRVHEFFLSLIIGGARKP